MMIRFKLSNLGAMPKYMTALSAGADLFASQECIIEPMQTLAVPTGLYIESYELYELSPNTIPELQIRARSSLAFKHGILLANGVGTVDLDYPDEIKVLLWNSNHEKTFSISPGERVAQILLAYTYRIQQFEVGGVRTGGFGSTNASC